MIYIKIKHTIVFFTRTFFLKEQNIKNTVLLQENRTNSACVYISFSEMINIHKKIRHVYNTICVFQCCLILLFILIHFLLFLAPPSPSVHNPFFFLSFMLQLQQHHNRHLPVSLRWSSVVSDPVISRSPTLLFADLHRRLRRRCCREGCHCHGCCDLNESLVV